MIELTLLRAQHALGVVLWIGGVAFVTTILLHAVRRLKRCIDQVPASNPDPVSSLNHF